MRSRGFTLSIDEYRRLREMARVLGWDENYACAQLVHEGPELLQLAGALVSRRLEPAHPDAVGRALLIMSRLEFCQLATAVEIAIESGEMTPVARREPPAARPLKPRPSAETGRSTRPAHLLPNRVR